MLVDYVNKCSKTSYGMTCKQFRQPVYGRGKRLQSKISSSWIDKKMHELTGSSSLWKDTKIYASQALPSMKQT